MLQTMRSVFSLERLSSICVYIVLILVNVSYCPGIILTPNYKIVMAVIMTAIGISLALNLFKDLMYAISLYIYYGVFALTVCCITFLFYDVFIFSATSNIFLTITCFLLGYSCYDHSPGFIEKCMRVYALSALFLGMYSVFINLGGFIISEQYAFSVKNSSGVLLGTAIILCAFILNSTEKKIETRIWIMIMVLLSACLLTFRCRTSILSVFLSLIYYLHRRRVLVTLLQKNPLTMLSVVGLLAIAWLLDLLPFEFIYDSLFANKDTSSLDSVMSGRLSTYDKGMKVFSESPILGNALLRRHLPPIDNFIISNLSYNGIIGAILMFPPYIFTWAICLKGMLKRSATDLYPFLALFLICITSFTEGSYPFGPGTPVVCAWFLLGWIYKSSLLRNNENIME